MGGVVNTNMNKSKDNFAPVPKGNAPGPAGHLTGPGVKGAKVDQPEPGAVSGTAPKAPSRFKKRK